MQRVPTPELLDSDAGTAPEIAASLRDLDRINRWFGGVSTTETMIDRVIRPGDDRKLTLLEVASGAGDLPAVVRHQLSKRGIDLDVVLLDRARSHLNSRRPAVVGDALTLPFRDSSFDLVSSSLFVHHLSPPDVVRFGREALRVCRRAVLINDLVRHPLHLLLVYAGLPLFSRITRHDTIASVRQAYRIDEMRKMLSGIGASRIEISFCYLFRMGAIVWK